MGPKAQVRFAEKSIGAIVHHPVLIIGQNPGRQRKGEETNIVWEGNRSSDFLMYCLLDYSNIYLTNVCNYQEITRETLNEGIYDLKILIEYLQPTHIICLGKFAEKYFNLIAAKGLSLEKPASVHYFAHPSYVLRFNKDVEEYKDKIVNIVSRKWKT